MKVFITALAVIMIAAGPVTARTGADISRYDIPSTVSPEAAERLKMIYALMAKRPDLKRPTTLAEWDAYHDQREKMFGPLMAAVADGLKVTRTADTIGGVPVIRIRPANYRSNGRLLLYVHGGGWVLYSAKTSLATPALIASATGAEVISIDYTVAPRGTFQTVTDQVIAVWKAVLAGGNAPATIGMLGDSAGGNIVASSVLKMRDLGLALPGALYLLSPATDLTWAGDTRKTLAAADPVLSAEIISWGIEVYAPAGEVRNPYASPVYGDYSKAFPPTLIQSTTREIVLSDAVREYQAIRSGGHIAVLDIYEGLPHVFQGMLPDVPETRTAIARAAAFFDTYLAKR